MEFFDGVPIDDLAQVADLGVDPAPLVEEVVRAFFLTTVRWGAFHGDVHAGNMMLLRDGRIGVIDWGIVGRLDRIDPPVLLGAALGRPRKRGGLAGGDPAHRPMSTVRPSEWPSAFPTRSSRPSSGPSSSPSSPRPFGEVSLAGIMQAIQLQMARAQGMEAHQRSLRAIMRRLRTQRRVRRLADQAGGLMSDFDRGTFLLAKQLMYFERYGRLFVSDVPILNDRAFLEQLLAGVDLSDLDG